MAFARFASVFSANDYETKCIKDARKRVFLWYSMEQYATTAWPAQHRPTSNQNDGKKGRNADAKSSHPLCT
jgi:hypothetical protein